MSVVYVCGDCGNRIPDALVVQHAPGSVKAVELRRLPVCCGGLMTREEVPDSADRVSDRPPA